MVCKGLNERHEQRGIQRTVAGEYDVFEWCA